MSPPPPEPEPDGAYAVHWASAEYPNWQLDSTHALAADAIGRAQMLAARTSGIRLQAVDPDDVVIWPAPAPERVDA